MKELDLSALEVGEDAVAMEVVDPRTGDPMTFEVDDNGTTVTKSMVWNLFSIDGEAGRKAKAALVNARFKKGMLSSAKRNTAESLDDDAINLLARLVASWDGNGKGEMPYKGENYACTRDNAVLLLTKLPWLRKQVDQFVNDLSNYVGN